ncbi:hypothetical protein BH772_gp030 [Gordonia phage Bachita]|uniref:Uncharacterized protein n=1 Tax=Gordonia phage Bachita TaxID=1838061 RepID=A0A160DFW3_9CAUD|nr:hypothetical protein BH772_gp030 [Gordonia phage Bachita]ANA86855.1 hypothetical protein PBI_BACHITA_181 [Gordonia phage Bachita]
MKPLAMTKLRNQIRALDTELVVELRNVRINGVLQGCSGFITNPRDGRIVYVNTDFNHGTMYDQPFYRTAADTKDFRGGRNQIDSNYETLARDMVAFIHRREERSIDHVRV